MIPENSENILEVRGLKQYFYQGKKGPVKAVDGADVGR